MDNVFNVKISPEGKLSVYTKTKRFFREKLTKVSLIEFFNSSKRYLIQTGKYSIFPSMVGISPTTYLTNKAEFNLLNGFSDFNQRTTWKINNFSAFGCCLHSSTVPFLNSILLKSSIVISGLCSMTFFFGNINSSVFSTS